MVCFFIFPFLSVLLFFCLMKTEKQELKELLIETMKAMCDYRFNKGKCANCNDAMFCRAKAIIPKVENFLKNLEKDG